MQVWRKEDASLSKAIGCSFGFSSCREKRSTTMTGLAHLMTELYVRLWLIFAKRVRGPPPTARYASMGGLKGPTISCCLEDKTGPCIPCSPLQMIVLGGLFILPPQLKTIVKFPGKSTINQALHSSH